ncbi:MAG: hypothetical protein KA444_08405 [Bacteroidia bacterium]|nr:hypothetical protein [Bacteroidia bacterium]
MTSRNNLTLLLVTLLTILVSTSCKKENAEDVNEDYRTAYAGNYSCQKLCTFWSISQPQTDTSFNGSSSISIRIDPSTPNRIIVDSDTIAIDSSGSFNGHYDPPAYNNYSIQITGDSIYLNTFSGGLGGGTTCNSKGKRRT